jgi:plastocyanin domain-containing protein
MNRMQWKRVAIAAVIVGIAGVAVAVAGCGGGSGVKDRVAVEVTQDGFVPKEIPAKVGQPITLVFADMGIEKELPLNEAVEVTLTPDRQGELRFACDMDMVAGKLVVEP